MLSPKLQEIKEKITKKSSYLRTDSESALLKELETLEKHLTGKPLLEFADDIRKASSITSGPGGTCPCCGK